MQTNDQSLLFVQWLENNFNSNFDFRAAWNRYKKERLKDARTSPGPLNCSIRITYQGELRKSNKCKRCGVEGDQACPFFYPNGSRK